MSIDAGLAGQQYCYLTTTGRVTGKPHEVEIWFGLAEGNAYLLAGAGRRSDWVPNLMKQPQAWLRIGAQSFEVTGRIVEDAAEDAMARRLLVEKYQPGYGSDLSQWGRTALPVALEPRPA